jgi:hypothetical protein
MSNVASQNCLRSTTPKKSRSVLECGSPLPLSLAQTRVIPRHQPGATARRCRTADRILLAAVLLGLVAVPAPAADKSQKLFNGKDLTGWRQPTGTWSVAKNVALDPADPKHFVIAPGEGIVVNSATNHTVDLITVAEFGDLEAHLEFCVASHSNSGVYLMGRYEVQIYDSFGVAKDKYPGIECGGIYPRWINDQNVEGHSPAGNASKPAGHWQSFDITFQAPRFDATGKKTANAKIVKLVHNGKLIHQDIELNGPTRGPIAEDEKPTGPIRLQGDHGPVAYRNLRVKPLDLQRNP